MFRFTRISASLLLGSFCCIISSAQNVPIQFVSPQRVLNDNGLSGAYRALAGHFHVGASGLDFVYAGQDNTEEFPQPFADVVLNQGNRKFTVSPTSVGDLSDGRGPDLAGDFNGDGLTDLLTFALGGGFFTDLAAPDGTFPGGQSFQVDPANSVADDGVAADFDGNGTIDVAIVTDTTLVIELNDGSGNFRDAFTVPVPVRPRGASGTVAVGDINGDHIPDVVLVAGNNAGTSTLTVFLGTSSGAMRPGVSYPVTASFNARAVIGDLDGDGFGDIAFPTPQGFAIMKGSAAGTLTAGISITAPGATHLVLGDFNHDGKLDLAAGGTLPLPVPHNNYFSTGPSFVSVYFGLGNGAFGSPTVHGTGNQLAWLLAGDVDGSGHLDLVSFGAGDASLEILRNNGNGYYQAAPITYTARATGITTADFNHDGKPDVAVISTPSCTTGCKGTVTVFPGTGSNYFNPGTSYTLGMHGAAVAAGDVNGDGYVDLVVLNATPGDIYDTSVLLGKAGGSFAAAKSYTLGSLSNDVVLADANHDGKLDVIEDSGVAYGRGDGTFAPLTPFPGQQFDPSARLAVGDVNGDGRLDVVVASTGNCNWEYQVFLNSAHGYTAGASSYNDGQPVFGISLAQLRPGKPLDLLYSASGGCHAQNANGNVAYLSVLAGNGDGTFAADETTVFIHQGDPDPSTAGPIVVADFNGDGKLDAAMGTQGLFVGAAGNGDGTFQPQQIFTVANAPESFGEFPFFAPGDTIFSGAVTGDFDGDGRPDVMLTSGLGVSRLYNSTPRPK